MKVICNRVEKDKCGNCLHMKPHRTIKSDGKYCREISTCATLGKPAVCLKY